MSDTGKKVKAVIIGASGYTGAELVRILLRHSGVEISALTADRKAGMALGQSLPHLAGLGLPDLVKIEDVSWDAIDVAFCCLPHGTTQEVIAGLPEHLKVIDLSADFRFADLDTYAEWYGHPHRAAHLQRQAVYGLTEINHEQIASARLVACPGCYPTSTLLPLIPLIKGGLIETSGIVADSKTGATGAGRALKENMLYAEVAEGLSAYAVAAHRHGPEMDQGLSLAAGTDVTFTFTPHLAPMNRGILSTIYVSLKEGVHAADLRSALRESYENAPFVRVLGEGGALSTHHVRGSNHCLIGVFADRIPGRAILVSVIDNLVKGSSGQAVQNMNLMFGFAETQGLEQAPLFP